MRSFLDTTGDNALYRAANEKLDQRISQLKADGVDLDTELQILKALFCGCKGHWVSFNSDILFSYDICGPCEAHAILLAIISGLSTSVDDALVLKN